MVKNIRSGIASYGSLQSIEVYWDFDGHAIESSTTRLRAELSASGVSLIDCPGKGREGAAIKKMLGMLACENVEFTNILIIQINLLADMIFYAWDNPAPRTLVVITDDRDIAYALAMLEMKNYRIVLISPAGSHPDLTAQATVQLDWTRVVLGTNRGVNHERESRVRPSATARPPSSTRLRGSTISDHREPLTHESNDPPSKERRSVFFKSNDLTFDVFGNEDLHSLFMASPKTMGSLGLGDGPLFPRPQSSRATSSGSANVLNSKSPDTPSFTEPQSGSKEGGVCLHKVKGRAPAVPPEEGEHQFLSPCRDQLSHSPPNDIVRPPRPEETPSLSEGGPPMKNSGSTVVSRLGSQESKFSFIDVPAAMPTNEDGGHPDQTDAVNQGSQSIVLKPLPDDTYSGAMHDAGPSQSKILGIDATPAPPPLPTTLMPVPPARIFNPPKLVSKDPLPEKWVPLVKFLRKSGSMARTKKFMDKFLKAFPDAIAIAGCRRGVYIDVAIKEGVVERGLVRSTKGVYKPTIQLTAKYAMRP